MDGSNIVIHSYDYVTYEYCTNTDENGNCIERTQVIPFDSLQLQNQNNAESYSHTAVFVIVILLLVWFVKGIFRFIFPNRVK